ncbi:MAG: PP0621 family protein [Burkholderiaceae bacterium]
MKYLIVIAVVLLAYFVWRKQRERTHSHRAPPPGTPSDTAPPGATGTQAMVRCPVCALHLPEPDAVRGRSGTYCSEAHRQQAEG